MVQLAKLIFGSFSRRFQVGWLLAENLEIRRAQEILENEAEAVLTDILESIFRTEGRGLCRATSP